MFSQNSLLSFKDPGLISVLRRAKFRLEQSNRTQRLTPDILHSEIEETVHYPVVTTQPDQDIRVKEGQSFIIHIQAKVTFEFAPFLRIDDVLGNSAIALSMVQKQREDQIKR